MIDSSNYRQQQLMKDYLSQNLPNGLETTADMLLKFLSKSSNRYLKDIAEFLKLSDKLDEIKMLFDFAMADVAGNILHIRENIYDTGLDGILELRNHLAAKYDINEWEKRNHVAFNILNWFILRTTAKEYYKQMLLII